MVVFKGPYNKLERFIPDVLPLPLPLPFPLPLPLPLSLPLPLLLLLGEDPEKSRVSN